ncbi:Integrase, catalytic region (modular protein) [Mycobacterium canettii CIPT 140070017]|nr:Integrase, catalytic region (modular protein) [Mycobacterium canettii CIPT 140070017]
MAATIGYLFAKHKRTYGSPRITADLRDMGWRVSVNTVAALMREQGLVARRKRRRHGTTKPDKSARKAPDLLGRDFSPRDHPNLAWVGDLTEIPTDEGKLHLASVIDLHSRRVPGFAMGVHHDAALARAALCMAIAVRGGSVAGVIFHTDQGGEYTGELFASACRSARVTQSMGRTGSALDNAAAESFNSTLEWELLRTTTSTHVKRHVTRSPPGSTSITLNVGIPRTACSAPSTTNAPVVNNVVSNQPVNSTPRNGRHEPRRRRLRRRCPARRAPRQATGPPLRPQGSLPRSLRDGPTARP